MSIASRLKPGTEEFEGLLLLQSEQRLGRLIECLDDGFIRLVDHMGDDSAIVQAARVSYGAGTKKVSDDRNLIRYLMRNAHTSPFEMVEFKFHIRIPMDAWRQMVRHRTASINEYSTRYSEAIDSQQKTTEWRTQSGTNKQGSSGLLEEWPLGWIPKDEGVYFEWGDRKIWRKIDGELTPQNFLSQREEGLHKEARRIYEERLKLGVAREQARKDLPLSTYTEAYWKIDLHNLFHFLRLRMDSHAQLEIRTYADAIFKLIEPIVPISCEAFQDYRLDAMTLSGPEVEALVETLAGRARFATKLSDRETKEFQVKLKRLGLNG